MYGRDARVLGRFLVAGLLGLAAGCGGDGSSTGRLDLAITDAPVDRAEAVFLTLTGVTLQGVSGSSDQGPFAVPEDRQRVDLMAYQGSDHAVLLAGVEIEAGTYKLRLDADLGFSEEEQRSWIAFAADAPECQDLPEGAVMAPDGQTCRYPLAIPSGEQAGFRPKGEITITAGGTSAFTAEFDLRKNVVDPGSANEIAYKLKPTGLRLVDEGGAGAIAGGVDGTLFGPECPAAEARVYLYDRSEGSQPFAPDDMNPNNDRLVTSVSVEERVDGAQVEYRYEIGFVPAGAYAVALTCSDQDDPDRDEDLGFFAEVDDILVVAGQTTVQDLAADAP